MNEKHKTALSGRTGRLRLGSFLVLLLLVAAASFFMNRLRLNRTARVGVVLCGQETERWLRDGFFLRKELRKRNFPSEIVFTQNAKEQAEQIRRFVEKGISVLIVVPHDADSLKPELAAAKAAGCKIIAYDRMIRNSPCVDYYVSFNSEEIGKIMASSVVDCWKAARTPKRAVLIPGPVSDENTAALQKGILSVLNPFLKEGKVSVPGNEISLENTASEDWSIASGRIRMEQQLQHYGVPDAVICHSDNLAAGAIEVLKSQVSSPLVTGQDASRAAVRRLLDKRQFMTVFKDTRKLAEKAAQGAVKLVRGENPSTNVPMRNNGVVAVPAWQCPVEPVTQKNCRAVLIESGYYRDDFGQQEPPPGFVEVGDLIPDARLELHYCTKDNITGRPLLGCGAPKAVLTSEAGEALARAASFFRVRGYRLVIYDAYRPRKAGQDLFRWINNPEDPGCKDYYPRLDKAELAKQGYITAQSSHSRGSAVDVGLEKQNGDTVNMGGIFCLYDEISHPNAVGLDPQQLKNRELLRIGMEKNGFVRSPREWWHFQLSNEPYAENEFDFDLTK